jgi:hypothetical protein
MAMAIAGDFCAEPAYVSIRQHTSAYVSIRQHTSAYVSIRQTFAQSPDSSGVSVCTFVPVKLLYWYNSTNTDTWIPDREAEYA